MALIHLRTHSSQAVEYGINGMFIPFSYTIYDTTKLYPQALINIYHGVVIGALEISPTSPGDLDDIYSAIRLDTPNTEIILTKDPYDALGNVMRFLSSVDDSIGRDGDILFTTTDYKFYKRENGIYVFKFQMQGGSGVAVAAQWFFSSVVNNSLGVDGDLLMKETGQIYKKINGSYAYQMTVTGQAGTNGINGIDGTKIYLTTGANYTGTAVEGDLNIVSSNELYQFTGGIWVSKGFLKGEKGLKGDKGDDGLTPDFYSTNSFPNTLGKDGDIVLNPDDFKIYKKILGAFVFQAQLSAPEGSEWHYSDTVDDLIGEDGDFLLDENGDVYKRIAGVYELQVNIRGPIGNTGPSGTPGAKIYFNGTVDDTIGVNGDVLFVGAQVYKKDNGAYVLEGDFSSGGSGSGYIDWATFSNSAILAFDESTYYSFQSLVPITSHNSTAITDDGELISLPEGNWLIQISISAADCSYILRVELDTTVVIDKLIQGKDFSTTKSVVITTTEDLKISVRGTTSGVVPISGLDIQLFKLQEPGVNRQVSSIIDLTPSSCSGKTVYYMDTVSGNTSIPLSTTMTDADFVYVSLKHDTDITVVSSGVDKMKVIIYFIQDTTTPRVCNILTSNMLFEGFIQADDLVISSTINKIDMIGIEYDLALSKWKVRSFLNEVF